MRGSNDFGLTVSVDYATLRTAMGCSDNEKTDKKHGVGW
jgi:hypothetical protein